MDLSMGKSKQNSDDSKKENAVGNVSSDLAFRMSKAPPNFCITASQAKALRESNFGGTGQNLIIPMPFCHYGKFPNSSFMVAGSSNKIFCGDTVYDLTGLTDDSFVIETPSIYFPYLYEKPPVRKLKDAIDEMGKIYNFKKKNLEDMSVTKIISVLNDSRLLSDPQIDSYVYDSNDLLPVGSKVSLKDNEIADKKESSYFENPLGIFLMNIGCEVVKDFIQYTELEVQRRTLSAINGPYSGNLKELTIEALLFKDPMFCCEFCNFKTYSSMVLNHHYELPHKYGNRKYVCNFCKSKNFTKPQIIQHMENVHGINPRFEKRFEKYNCSFCDYSTNNSRLLHSHNVNDCLSKSTIQHLRPTDWEDPAKFQNDPQDDNLYNLTKPYQYLIPNENKKQ